MKHTKGTWYAYTSGIQPLIYTEETGKAIAVCYEVGEKETEANANLIAAAPELLEACKAVGDAMLKTQGFMPNFLEQAINKAEGRGL